MMVEGENHVGDVVIDHAMMTAASRADDVDVGQVEQGEEVVEDAVSWRMVIQA